MHKNSSLKKKYSEVNINLLILSLSKFYLNIKFYDTINDSLPGVLNGNCITSLPNHCQIFNKTLIEIPVLGRNVSN